MCMEEPAMDALFAGRWDDETVWAKVSESVVVSFAISCGMDKEYGTLGSVHIAEGLAYHQNVHYYYRAFLGSACLYLLLVGRAVWQASASVFLCTQGPHPGL